MDEEIKKSEKIAELQEYAYKTKDAKQRRRYDVARLYLQGRKKDDISIIIDISQRQVYNIINLYEEEGIEGLLMKISTGRKRKLDAEQEKELYKTITEKLPKDVGFDPFCNWTASLACQYVKEKFGIDFSERGMRDVFYRLNISYTRPTYVLAKADKSKQKEFEKNFEGLKKNFLMMR